MRKKYFATKEQKFISSIIFKIESAQIAWDSLKLLDTKAPKMANKRLDILIKLYTVDQQNGK